MNCPNCGNELLQGAKFCGDCGTPIQQPEQHQETVQNSMIRQQPEPNYVINAEIPIINTAAPKKKKSRSFKVMIIALFTALALAVTGVAIYFGTDLFKDEAPVPEPPKEVVIYDPVEITVWSTEIGAQSTYERLVNEWNNTTGREKNVFINWVTVTDSSEIDVAMNNGTLPEIVSLNSIQVKKAVSSDTIIPIEELPGGKEFLEEYNVPGVEDRNVFDGKQYNVQSRVITAGLAYNKDLFVQAEIVDENGEAKAPTTIEEVKEYAKRITSISDGVYGFAFPLKFGLGYTVDAMTTNSFNYANPAVKTDLDELTVTLPGYKDRYQWIFDMKADGSIFPGAETLDNDTARAYFSTGIVGMIPACSWDADIYTNEFPVNGFEWDVVEFPVLDGYTESAGFHSFSGGMSISESALASDEIAAATMEVYKFIYSLETRTALYEDGIALSIKADVYENADSSKVIPQFAKFASFIDHEYKQYVAQSYIVEGDTWGTLFQKVWMGDMSLESAIAVFEENSTAGLRDAVEKGVYDVEKQKEIEEQKRADYES